MATEAGSSYVTIFPKMAKGFGSQISKSINSSGIGKKIASGISKGILAGGAAIGTATGITIKKAFDNYSQFEQLVGGVETLFKDSAPTVEKYADNAFKTAGLSANQYMETVTSFSASMISAVGGDTAKAAELSNQAIIDMSDNANKMGTSMDEIQRAYMSMARGNYGMLDSLKLGRQCHTIAQYKSRENGGTLRAAA